MTRRDPIIAGFHVGASTAWVYGALDSRGGLNQLGENDRMFAASVVFLGLLNLLAGYFSGGVWVLALPLIVVAIAVPAGDFPTSRPEYPVWFGLALLTPLLVVLAGIGVAVRRFRSSPRSDP